jgi:hypothetical protein
VIYLYDNAICDDLRESFEPENDKSPVVKVMNPEVAIGLAAQIQEDSITFPVAALYRSEDFQVDVVRTNFRRIHTGIATVIDPETNNIYSEKSLPITLSYDLTLLATNMYDMDEMVKEIMFKYSDMYFLTIKLPYESNRKMRFGVVVDLNKPIARKSSNPEYLTTGQLYQTTIPLKCEGCVLVTYTPQHLQRMVEDDTIVILDPKPKNK